MACTACGLSPDVARAYDCRGRLLRSVLLSPADFFDAVVPLYNALNGTYVIGGVNVEYSKTLSDPVGCDRGRCPDA
ncbi:hypothetical protein GS424_008535 [Eggerthella guodeyinii]|uniref:Uncharacterized protein n=1 Tax=Eggerthella guodeyinii TaxID=2690837 RepID=A0A6L7IQK4_9ACTN|nr:hypothetical protein [Eggerthella guodeyinii]QOS69866.1 hypothetical protein GS424_008535 [Eggerthella guodeyinii]